MPASEPSASPVSAPADWRLLLTPTELAEYEKHGDAYRTDVALHRDRPPARERRVLPATERAPNPNHATRTLKAVADHPAPKAPTAPVASSTALLDEGLRYYTREAVNALARIGLSAQRCRECNAPVGTEFSFAGTFAAGEPRLQVFCAKCGAKLPRQPLRELAVPLPAVQYRAVGTMTAEQVAQAADWASGGATDSGIVALFAMSGVTVTERAVKSARQAIRRLRATRRAA